MSYNKTLKRLKSAEIKMDSLNKLLKEYDGSDVYTETLIEGHQVLISSLKKRIAYFEPIFNAINDSIKLIDDKIKVRENHYDIIYISLITCSPVFILAIE